MVNISPLIGCIPENWRTAVVIPLLKKPGFDLVYKNFHLVSNLPFISKVVEKAALQQLLVCCEKNAPLPRFQSGFCKYHSTETALLKVQNDILMSMDNKEVTLLVLLDLSAAFDTIEHSILNILQQDFGVVGTALNWFDSFLSGRKQRILAGDKTSDNFNLNCGVPQGSSMGPFLFTLYVFRLLTLFLSTSLLSMVMLTTSQIYLLSFRPCSIHSKINAVSVIEKCIADVCSWFIGNRLMINDAKTDFLFIGTCQQLEVLVIINFCNRTCITVGDPGSGPGPPHYF